MALSERVELLLEKVLAMGQPKRKLIPEGALIESLGGERMLEGATFEPANRTINGVTLISVGWSLNGRYYTPESLRGAAGLFEGAKGYINHDMWSYSRDMRDLCCRFSGVYFDEAAQALKGNMRVFAGTPNAWVYDLAQEAPNMVGLSVVIEGQTQTGVAPDGRTGPQVTAILVAHSCDVVPEPAAGGGVDPAREAVEGKEQPVELEKATLEDLKAKRPDLFEAVTAAAKPAPAPEKPVTEQVAEAVSKALAERDQLAEAKAGREKAVDALLEEAKLPNDIRAKLRPDLVELEESTAKRAVEVAKQAYEEAQAAAQRPPVRDAGDGQTDEKTRTAEAVAKVQAGIDAAFGLPAEKEAK